MAHEGFEDEAIAARPTPEAMAKTVSFSMRLIAGLELTLREVTVQRGYRGGCKLARELGSYLAAILTSEISAPRMTTV
jgi:hypothetical protein